MTAAAALVALLAGASALSPQDSLEALREARDAQARFERERRSMLPWTVGVAGGPCGEVVGRFCWRPDRSQRSAPPEPPAIGRARLDLLVHLAGLAGRVPGDRWIAGQRVRYRVEGAQVAMAAHGSPPSDAAAEALEHLTAAETVARECRMHGDPDGWCAALLGLVLHVSGRVQDAERAFAEAARVASWLAAGGRDLTDVMDRDTRRAWDQAADTAAFLARFWTAADPFWTLPGNDRWTEHQARRVMARVQSDARNPFGLSWGDDLRELHVRFGWEVGWERARPSSGSLAASGATIIGHQQDDGYAFLPSLAALTGAGAAGTNPPGRGSAHPEAWTPRAPPSREGYRPAYVDTLVPARHQLAAFRRGDSLDVRVAISPPDPRSGGEVGGGREPGAGEPPGSTRFPNRVVRGVAFVPWPGPAPPSGWVDAQRPKTAGGATLGRQVSEVAEGAGAGARSVGGVIRMRAEVPVGAYVASVEWIEPDGTAARARYPIRRDTLAPGVLAVSDLLLHVPTPTHDDLAPDGAVAPSTAESGYPRTLDDVAPSMLPVSELRAGRGVGVFWEVYGLDARGEAVSYDLSLRKRGESFFRRAGRWLGLAGPVNPVRVRWTDAARPTGQTYGRSVRIATPATLAPGEYVLRLVVRTAGREDAISERALTVR